MSDAVSILGLLALGGVFLSAAYLAYKKGWKAGAYISLLASVFFFVMSLPATRGFVRSAVWAAFVTSLEATGQGLVRLNDTVSTIREGMHTEEESRKAQQSELELVQSETRKMQDALQEAQRQIEAQQVKITDLGQLLKSIYEAGVSRSFSTSADSEKIAIVSHGPERVTLYALLPEAPIRQTLQLQYFVSTQPRNSYEVDGNLVTFRWAQSESSLRAKPLEFIYVPDPTTKPEYSKLEKRGDRVFVDGRPLPYGYSELDPALAKAAEEKKRTAGPDAPLTWADFEAAVKSAVPSR